MPRATLFKSNRSQAVRLPKAAAFPAGVRELEVQVVGAARLLTPAGTSWEAFFDEPGIPDFPDREQPEGQTRGPL